MVNFVHKQMNHCFICITVKKNTFDGILENVKSSDSKTEKVEFYWSQFVRSQCARHKAQVEPKLCVHAPSNCRRE